jgi:ATP-binding cassette subfamily C (CFTR/MRP) protein 1
MTSQTVSMIAVMLVAIGGSEAQKNWFEATEIRVAHVVRILADFKSVKMMGHTAGLFDSLGTARLIEVQRSQRFRKYVIVVATLAQAATALVPAFGIVTHILLRRSGDDKILDSSRAFGTLTLCNILSSSIGLLVDGVFGTVTAIGCISRIQDVCTKNYRLDPRQKNVSLEDSKLSVVMNQASAKYKKDGDNIIQNLSFEIKPGAIIRVQGPAASGKSTLLKMILGEVRYCTGQMAVGETIIGYCDQKPWLDHTSIRDNITGPAPFDPERYAHTIRICALELDLKNIPEGDACLCFGNGSTLSGGQKARIVGHHLNNRIEKLANDTVVFSSCHLCMSADSSSGRLSERIRC